MASPSVNGEPSASGAVNPSELRDCSHSARKVPTTVDTPDAAVAQGTVLAPSSKHSTTAQLLPSAVADTVASGNSTTGNLPFPQAARGASTRSSLSRQGAIRQTSIVSRVSGQRTKSARSGADLGVVEQQRDTVETQAETTRGGRNCGGSSPKSALCNEVFPSVRGRVARNAARSEVETGAGATPVAAAEDGTCGRGFRRVAADVGVAGAACAGTPQAAADELSSTVSASPAAFLDCRGPRRSLRQALLANSGKAQAPGPGATSTVGEGPVGGTGAAAATGPGSGNPTAVSSGTSGALAGSGTASGGRRRMRQPHRQLLQSYIVGQQHQQMGAHADERTSCLAEWLDIRGGRPCCCCSASCVSCCASWSGKANIACTAEGTFGNTTRGSGGGGVRSVLDAYATLAANRDKQQRYHHQQQQCSVGSRFAAGHSHARSGNGVLVCPSWFESSIDLDLPSGVAYIRPSSPSRSAVFFSQQTAWEEEDIADATEAAAATAGTPWPKDSTSCSFGGYGSATRNGGQVPLCCYCGLPLRPPTLSSLKGGGAESGCPLAAAAAAASALGLTGWTQWCRCCTRVYGDLRLQHQPNATGLPFESFALPRAPLRYLLCPLDEAKDTPGGAGAVAAALAAAAVADSRRSRMNDDNAAAASAEVEGDSVAVSSVSTPNSSSKSSGMGGIASQRRTRSGHHFVRTPAARTSSRSSNNAADTMRLMGASCCWPSSASSVSYVQPLARIQQRLTQLQQHHADQAQHTQQQQYQGPVEGDSVLAELDPAPLDKLPSHCSTTTANSSLGAAAPAMFAQSSQAHIVASTPATKGSSGASHTSEMQASVDLEDAEATSAKLAEPGTLRGPAKAASLAAPAATQKTAQRLPPAAAPITADVRPSCYLTDSQASNTIKGAASKTASSTTKARTVVIPRVYLESNSGCYVATAFDSVGQRLVQKRFCCTVLGEQRAHALACQWLRWVSKGASTATVKARIQNTASGLQAAPSAVGAAPPSSPLLADGPATVPASAASPGRRAATGGVWGVRRGSHRVDSFPPHHERQLKRRRRCGEALDGSDRDEGSHPSQRFSAAAAQGQQTEEV